MWKCDEVVKGGRICPKACHRREVFERHLEVDHKIVEQEERDARQERCRVDRNSNTKFWCGFCEEVKEVDPRSGTGAWSERYDHIGNHFTGGSSFEKRDIKDWISPDSDSSDAEMGEDVPERGSQTKRKREASTESEEAVQQVKRLREGRG